MARRIWRGDFDTLIAYQSTASILAGAVGAISGCRLRVVHQTCTPGETPRLVRLLDKLVGTLGLYSANIINSAVDLGRVRPLSGALSALDDPDRARARCAGAGSEPASDARRRFDLPVAKPLLLNVGRLAAQKNQDVLIRALACLPQAHLVLAGAGPKDDPRSTSSRSRSASTTGCTCSAPLPAEDIADLYAAADLFVFPSTWETFGLAAVEAAMVGMPMVVADLAGAARSVARRRFGAGRIRRAARRRGLDRGDRRGARGAAGAARRGGIRAHHVPQIFAAADDRKLSQPVRGAIDGRAAARSPDCSRRKRRGLDAALARYRRARRSLLAGWPPAAAIADPVAPAFKRGATLVEFFEFPAIDRRRRRQNLRRSAVSASRNRR